jgi:hypothetical protein
MHRIGFTSLALLTLGGLVAAGCSDSNSPSHPVVDLVSCPPSLAGGDNLTRGLYIDSFPGSTLHSATGYFGVVGSGDRTIALTARADSFNGTLLGSDTVTVAGVDGDSALAVSFDLGGSSVTTGSIVTFAYSTISDTGGSLSEVTSSSNALCPLVQTDSTSPPLDTDRRAGLAFKIRGKE